jgi:cell division protein FtsL
MESQIRSSIVKKGKILPLSSKQVVESVASLEESNVDQQKTENATYQQSVSDSVESRFSNISQSRQLRRKDRYIKRYKSQDSFYLRTPIFKPVKVRLQPIISLTHFNLGNSRVGLSISEKSLARFLVVAVVVLSFFLLYEMLNFKGTVNTPYILIKHSECSIQNVVYKCTMKLVFFKYLCVASGSILLNFE